MKLEEIVNVEPSAVLHARKNVELYRNIYQDFLDDCKKNSTKYSPQQKKEWNNFYQTIIKKYQDIIDAFNTAKYNRAMGILSKRP